MNCTKAEADCQAQSLLMQCMYAAYSTHMWLISDNINTPEQKLHIILLTNRKFNRKFWVEERYGNDIRKRLQTQTNTLQLVVPCS